MFHCIDICTYISFYPRLFKSNQNQYSLKLSLPVTQATVLVLSTLM